MLQRVAPRPSYPQPKSRGLHRILDVIQSVTPEFLRAPIRKLYLKHFYYRMFPENSPRAGLATPDLFAGFKLKLCRNLSMDFGELSTPCEPGLVSVVLSVYNGEAFVAEAIESVLAQTYDDFELLIVDDGSTDRTPEILARFSVHPKVRLLHQANRKLPAALNTGFAVAGGEFFTWISHDNRMHPNMLVELVGFLKAHSDVEMVYADEQLIDEHGAPALNSDFCNIYQSPGGSNILRRPRDSSELNFIQDNFIGGCFLYRSWAARLIGEYSEQYFGFEDYDYWLRMNALFRIAHLGKADILHSYRLHPHSLTAREKELRISDRARYFTAVEAERRKFFTGDFDIHFVGAHPWVDALAQAYRRSGHTVDASSKSITIGDGGFAQFWEDRVQVAGVELVAPTPASLEYPLLAAANAWLWNHRRPPQTSLIICTDNPTGILPHCLQAARAQTLDAREYEIIVVDSSSAGNTRAIVEQWPEIRYLYWRHRGFSEARNIGAHAARAPIVTYIDDDAIPAPDFLEKILDVFSTHPDAGCVGGRIEIHLPPEIPTWYSQHFAGYYSEFNPGYADLQRVTEMCEYPFSANVSYRIEALERIGFFHQNSGADELDAEFRIAQAGYEIYYTPHAHVERTIKPDRLKWSHIAKSARAAGRNWAYYELKLLHEKRNLPADVRMFFGTLARMVNRKNFHVARSQNIFYRAKLLRKLRHAVQRP